MNLKEVEAEIAGFMPVRDFLQIHARLGELRQEEDRKLGALAELQQMFLMAGTDEEREHVKEAVGRIRDLSKAARMEIRELNRKIQAVMPVELSRDLYTRYLEAKHRL